MAEQQEKPLIPYVLCVIGAVLMMTNAFLSGIIKGPVILATSSVSSPTDVINSTTAGDWARISFGFRGWAGGLGVPIMLIFAAVILYVAALLYMKPINRKILGLTIITLSAVTIPLGGGFIIGSVLGIIGGAIGYEWPTPWKKTFFGKLLRALRIDSSFYEDLKQDTHALKSAAYALIFVNILSGLGTGFYSFGVDNIMNSKTLDIPFRTLLLGEPILDVSALAPATINIGLCVVKWLLLSLLLYVLIALVIVRKADFSKIAAGVAFAYVPIGLQFFMLFTMTSAPLATFTWPFFAMLITNLWMILGLFVAMRQLSEISMTKSIGIISLAEAGYLLINQEFIMKMSIPHSITFVLQPDSIFLGAVACLVALAVLLGVFSNR